MSARRRRVLALALLAVAAGCGGATRYATDVAATIEGDPVPYRLFERYLWANVEGGSASEPEQALDQAVISQLFDQFIDQKLLVRLAASRGLAPDPQGAARPAIDALLGDDLETAVDARDVADHYQAERHRYQRPAQIRLWQILVLERDMAAAVAQSIAAGEDFKAAAERLASDPDAGYCGDQGWLGHDDLPPSLADAIFALDEGEVSPIMEAEYGFYLFQAEARQEATVASLDEVQAEIRETLVRAARDQRMAAYLRAARERYDVDVFRANLPFDYQGSYAEITED